MRIDEKSIDGIIELIFIIFRLNFNVYFRFDLFVRTIQAYSSNHSERVLWQQRKNFESILNPNGSFMI